MLDVKLLDVKLLDVKLLDVKLLDVKLSLFVAETSGQKKELKAENVAPGAGIDLEFETDGSHQYVESNSRYVSMCF